MLKIEGKTFMNIQEAVQWLLENNALPFQCTANYQANTEIGLGTIVNPSPAKVRIGSLIFFADSKVSTVIGITDTGFICSDKYNNLVDDIAYVTNVAINGSGHLITTLSDGQTIDAGIIKQVSDFSINASQHLVVTFNDGTSTDLGAIFSGNITVSGNLTVVGGISGAAITGDSIIETMSGYTFDKTVANGAVTHTYAGVVKNGNKITFAIAGKVRNVTDYSCALGRFYFPSEIGNKLFPVNGDYLGFGQFAVMSGAFGDLKTGKWGCAKQGSTGAMAYLFGFDNILTADTDYYFRFEITFLLSENLAS